MRADSFSAEAVKFMWNRVVLGIEGKRVEVEGRGCILAHSMVSCQSGY